MPAPTITAIPTPPVRSDAPADFATKADAFAAALPQFVTEANTSAAFVDQRAIDANASAAAAAASEAAAASSESNAAASAELAGQYKDSAEVAAAAAGASAGLPALAGNANKALVVKPDESGVQFAALGSEIKRSARTANAMLAAADRGRLIDITSGTFTQTIDAAAALGDGWYCYLRNSGTGTITVDPNASEAIDGFTTGILTPGLMVLLTCDGVGFSAQRIGPQTVMEVKTSGISWTCPLGVRQAKITVIGGGGGGAVSSSSAFRSGGGGGGVAIVSATLSPGASYTYAIGVGGSGGVGVGTIGSAGGNSTFQNGGTTYTANGGGGGTADAWSPAAGGTASNGNINATGGIGWANASISGNGGASLFGNPGITGGGSLAYRIGSGFGAGGAGGSSSYTTGGNGAPGAVILEY